VLAGLFVSIYVMVYAGAMIGTTNTKVVIKMRCAGRLLSGGGVGRGDPGQGVSYATGKRPRRCWIV